MITPLRKKKNFFSLAIDCGCLQTGYSPPPPILVLVMHVSVAWRTTLIRVKSTSASSDSLKAGASRTAFHVDQCSTAMSDKEGDEVGVRAVCEGRSRETFGHLRGDSPRATTQVTQLKASHVEKSASGSYL